MENPKIHVTIDYTQFNHYDENRKILSDHVNKFVEDESFPSKFPTCPILVNKDFYIIDGQHRFEAAKILRLPIYFIKDDEATEMDILHRNTKQKAWRIDDYIHFYANKSKSYKFIDNLKKIYPSITTTILITAIGQISNVGQKFINQRLKNGEVKLTDEHIQNITEFLDIYVPFIMELKRTRGRDSVVFFNRTYVGSCATLFCSDRAIFDKIIQKGLYCPYKTPHFYTMEDCINFLLKMASWRNTRANAMAGWEGNNE